MAFNKHEFNLNSEYTELSSSCEINSHCINTACEIENVLPGMVLLKGFLLPELQQCIVNEMHRLGKCRGGFYRPVYASGSKCKLKMMCLGKHWNVVTEEYEMTRSNFDDAPVLPFPETLNQVIDRVIQIGKSSDGLVMGDRKTYTPDICVANYYTKAGRNGLHIDKDESKRSMDAGSPVVSFSIGASASFAYCMEYPASSQTMVPQIELNSGDVLIFGGPSRKIVHALTRVHADRFPPWLNMRKGRLNLTFREY